MLSTLRYYSVFKWISKYCDVPAEMIDLGCGGGELVAYLRKKGFIVYGVDPIFKKNEKDRNEESFCYASLADLKKRYTASPQAVIMNFSLEHLDDPVLSLGQMSELLAANGRLFIRVPDLDYINKNKWLASFQLKPGEHKYLFGREELRSLLIRTGYEVINIEPDISLAALITYPCSIFPGLDPYANANEPEQAGISADPANRSHAAVHAVKYRAAKILRYAMLVFLSVLFAPFFLYEFISGRSPLIRVAARKTN